MATTPVLVVAGDPELVRTLLARWQAEAALPPFFTLRAAECNGTRSEELVIVAPDSAAALAQFCSGACRDNIVHVSAGDPAVVRAHYPGVAVLRHQPGWEDTLVVLAAEILRRRGAQRRALEAEHRAASLERYAALGRYTLEGRHNLNNAITSVLGNAELLLLQEDRFEPRLREQFQAIHTMALRILGFTQGFSSLDLQMRAEQPESDSAEVAAGRT